MLPAETELVRVYFAGGPHPGTWRQFRRFGPTDARFDHHDPTRQTSPDRAILYAAGDLTTAIAEVFQRTGVIDVRTGDPYLAILRTSRPIPLLDLRSDWPTRAGASQALGSGSHASARGWSRAVWEDHPAVEGIAWHSSMRHDGTAYALYERAADALEADPVANLTLGTNGLALPLAHAADLLGFGLVLDQFPLPRTLGADRGVSA